MEEFGIPPPPQKIFEDLNGHLIGHYVMKKALSVAVYNHFCDVGIKRKLSRTQLEQQQLNLEDNRPAEDRQREEERNRRLVESDFKRDYFENESNVGRARKGSNDSGFQVDLSPAKTGAYMTPIVARVIIEASSHKVHLRASNTLTFDSTGSSRPLDAIANNLAKFLEVPYVRCDCKRLVPRGGGGRSQEGVPSAGAAPRPATPAGEGLVLSASNPVLPVMPQRNALKRRRSLQGGSLQQLLQGFVSETLQKVVEKMFRKSNYNVERTERGIILFDAMESLGSLALEDEEDAEMISKELYKEIMEVIAGTQIEVTKKSQIHSDVAGQKRPNPDSEEVVEKITLSTSNMFFICFGVNDHNSNVATHKEAKTKATDKDSAISMGTGSPSKKGSNNRKTNSSCSSRHSFGSCDSYDSSDEDDDSFVGLRENKMAQALLAAKNSPIPQCQTMWGMKDLELKIAPEALEIIANQATYQNAGVGGVRTILEKLLFTVKFEILGKNVQAVEITEDFVLGKGPPVYHYFATAERKSSGVGFFDLNTITEEDVRTKMSEYDENVLEELEL